MAKFQLKTTSVVVTTYDFEYQIEADSPEEAEAIFRHPNGDANKLSLVSEQKITRGPTRAEIPVVIFETCDESSEDETRPFLAAGPVLAQ